MSAGLTLIVTTPLAQVLAEEGVASIRVEDASGGFGVMPRHADLLTVLGASVLRWRRDDGVWRFCALRGGVMRVIDGARVEIACREAVPGDDLDALERIVREQDAAETDDAKRARGEQVRLHARAIRGLMRRLGSHHADEDLAEDFR